MNVKFFLLISIILLTVLSGCATYQYSSEINDSLTTSSSKSNSGYYFKDYFFNTIPGVTYKVSITSSNTNLGISIYDNGVEKKYIHSPGSLTYSTAAGTGGLCADVWISTSNLMSGSVSYTVKIEKL